MSERRGIRPPLSSLISQFPAHGARQVVAVVLYLTHPIATLQRRSADRVPPAAEERPDLGASRGGSPTADGQVGI